MMGTCWKCGGKAYVNPYRDSPFFGMCFACQMKEKEQMGINSEVR